MTVGELIAHLEGYPEDAEVLLMTQPSYPFENTIEGVCQREDFADDEDEDGSSADVFICEGEQLRYGSKDAFDNACDF
jgi:hypothetical protein